MRYLRLVLVAACGATLIAGSALAQGSAQLGGPVNLKPFLLRANEPAVRDFPRTPSFSWSPVRGAYRYEFQLSKTATFQDGTIFWSNAALHGPAVAVPLTLPWMTGAPYAAYARVRAVTSRGQTAWSNAYGFNISWLDVPKVTSTYAGLARWTPIEGATSYQVWFTDINRTVETRVNAVDEREFYEFHQGATWTGTIHWRVRAVRRVAKLQGFITPVNFGPWSQTFTSTNPAVDTGPLHPVAAVTALATSTMTKPAAHEMTPAFVFTGSQGLNGLSYPLYRIYVFSDRECVNPVFRGAVVGSPAYAPRNKGTLLLPLDNTGLAFAANSILPLGAESNTFMADGTPVRATEAGSATATGPVVTTPAAPAPGAGSSAPPEGTSDPATNTDWARIELLESGWPNGQFYWTVVPVKLVPRLDSAGTVTGVDYFDAEIPQDECAAGHVMAFGKASTPVVAGVGSPYASGLSPGGRLIAATSNQARFYGKPLVAWRPAVGADTYEVEWSKTKVPWRAVNRIEVDGGTATTLPLKPGAWWYRIRGINTALPTGHQFMTWSTPLQVSVAKPIFKRG
jgi:hypothetical protein